VCALQLYPHLIVHVRPRVCAFDPSVVLIAQVGRAMSSTEEDAYPIMRSLDVDYVLVIFGGLIGYGSDDINKVRALVVVPT
jgi:hypothetical protein